jgi:hypothetical protein
MDGMRYTTCPKCGGTGFSLKNKSLGAVQSDYTEYTVWEDFLTFGTF